MKAIRFRMKTRVKMPNNFLKIYSKIQRTNKSTAKILLNI